MGREQEAVALTSSATPCLRMDKTSPPASPPRGAPEYPSGTAIHFADIVAAASGFVCSQLIQPIGILRQLPASCSRFQNCPINPVNLPEHSLGWADILFCEC